MEQRISDVGKSGGRKEGVQEQGLPERRWEKGGKVRKDKRKEVRGLDGQLQGEIAFRVIHVPA